MALTSESRVDWVHPSVRDLVIDYLVEHDAERRTFLSTTTPAGLILALSTGGGATGNRQFPLLVSEADWAVATARLEELAAKGAPPDQLALARGVLAPLNSRIQFTERERPRLQQLAKRFQHALRTNWDRTQTPIRTAALSAYYETSIIVGELMPSPRLAPTWQEAFDRAVDSIASMEPEEGAFQGVDALLQLATLLRDNEPRFLRIVQFPLSFTKAADALVGRMAEIVSGADDLDADEVVEEDDDEGHSFEVPVEPEASEYNELQWFTEAIDSAEAITIWFPGHRSTLGTIVSSCEDHRQIREQRQENWDAWKSDQRGEDRDEVPRGYVRSSQFDIDDFFSDL